MHIASHNRCTYIHHIHECETVGCSVVSNSLQPHGLQALLSLEFSSQVYWSELPFPSLGDLPNPGIKPGSPALQADSLPSESPGKLPASYAYMYFIIELQNLCSKN